MGWGMGTEEESHWDFMAVSESLQHPLKTNMEDLGTVYKPLQPLVSPCRIICYDTIKPWIQGVLQGGTRETNIIIMSMADIFHYSRAIEYNSLY